MRGTNNSRAEGELMKKAEDQVENNKEEPKGMFAYQTKFWLDAMRKL